MSPPLGGGVVKLGGEVGRASSGTSGITSAVTVQEMEASNMTATRTRINAGIYAESIAIHGEPRASLSKLLTRPLAMHGLTTRT